MERLTYNDDGCWQVHGADEMLCKQVCEEYSNCESCPIGKAIDRLAEYENKEQGQTAEVAELKRELERVKLERDAAAKYLCASCKKIALSGNMITCCEMCHWHKKEE